MKLVELKCKNCGAVLKVQPDTIDIHCEHCKANYKLDDEAQHIKYDDMEKAGYDYEKGKLKARQEHEQEKQRQKIEAQQAAAKAEKDAKMKKWIILAWIFLFPIMFTYWLWTKSTLDKRIKILLTVGVWLLFIIVGFSSNTSTQNIDSGNSNSSANSSVMDFDKKYESVLGKKDENPYYDNEKSIRNFVISYNENYDGQITRVDWRNNHTKAFIYFGDKSAEVHSSDGMSLKFGFSNGKESVGDYDQIIKNIVLTLNYGNAMEDDIDAILAERKTQNGTSNLSGGIHIEYLYTESQVGYQAADHYWITISSDEYRIDTKEKK